jgi:hypothetical protein
MHVGIDLYYTSRMGKCSQLKYRKYVFRSRKRSMFTVFTAYLLNRWPKRNRSNRHDIFLTCWLTLLQFSLNFEIYHTRKFSYYNLILGVFGIALAGSSLSTEVLNYLKSLVLLYKYEIGENIYCVYWYYHCVSLQDQKRYNNVKINKYTQCSY